MGVSGRCNCSNSSESHCPPACSHAFGTCCGFYALSPRFAILAALRVWEDMSVRERRASPPVVGVSCTGGVYIPCMQHCHLLLWWRRLRSCRLSAEHAASARAQSMQCGECWLLRWAVSQAILRTDRSGTSQLHWSCAHAPALQRRLDGSGCEPHPP